MSTHPEETWSRETASQDILTLLERIDEVKGEVREDDDDYIHIDIVNAEYCHMESYECSQCQELYDKLTEAKEAVEAAQLEVKTVENRLDDAHSACKDPWG